MRCFGLAALAVLLVTLLAPLPTAAQDKQIGTLECEISGGIGFIIGSRKEATCMFSPTLRGPREVYVGSISRFGLDVGATSSGQLTWAVYATNAGRHGTLAGVYTGASAEAFLAVRHGANALVGGSDRMVTLQPLASQGQAGLSVAAGVTELLLMPAR